MPWYNIVIIVYLVVTNAIAIGLTISDKQRAKKGKRRIPEKTLLLWAALSCCVGMYITMHIIRHKTQKPKFMVGIPIFFVVECAVYFLSNWLINGGIKF